MKRKKSSSDPLQILGDVRALRSDQPDPTAVDRVVDRVLAYTPAPVSRRTSHPIVWRAATVAACVGAGAFLLLGNPQRANAANLGDIAEALRQQPKRHAKTFRKDSGGALVLTNEDWIDGRKHADLFIDETGQRFYGGFDGETMFRVTPTESILDDVEPSAMPVEDLDSYLMIPGAKLAGQRKSEGLDVYTIDCPAVRFDLFVDPDTRLPMRRDVMTLKGRFIERNEYQYPSQIDAATFRAPKVPGMTDYPALRKEVAKRLRSPGITKEVGGVKISLKAVIYGKHSVLALWTGGARGDLIQGQEMWIDGLPKPLMGARPEPFTVPINPSPRADALAPITVDGKPVLGDASSYADLKLEGPFTLNIPVWAEDRTRPILAKSGERLGYHSRLVGRLSFPVKEALRADDPQRVLWRPSGSVVKMATGSGTASP